MKLVRSGIIGVRNDGGICGNQKVHIRNVYLKTSFLYPIARPNPSIYIFLPSPLDRLLVGLSG